MSTRRRLGLWYSAASAATYTGWLTPTRPNSGIAKGGTCARAAIRAISAAAVLCALITATGCFMKGQVPSELHRICTRYVDSEGFLRGRDVLVNDEGAARLGQFRYSHRGTCEPDAQGPPQRVTVCLVASSPCHHDRTTNVWEDQVDAYFDRYPGSYRGKCEGSCSEHADDCLQAARAFKGFDDFLRWQQWMREIRCRRGPYACSGS